MDDSGRVVFVVLHSARECECESVWTGGLTRSVWTGGLTRSVWTVWTDPVSVDCVD